MEREQDMGHTNALYFLFKYLSLIFPCFKQVVIYLLTSIEISPVTGHVNNHKISFAMYIVYRFRSLPGGGGAITRGSGDFGHI